MPKADRSHYRRHPQKEQHGGSKTSEYRSWSHMIARCHTPSDCHYQYYGARGISVCDQWRHSFATFILNMGKCPEGFTIDRIDNGGNYTPDNCRWANKSTQMRNRRNAVMLTFNGKTQNMVEWATELGLGYKMLQHRYARGWPAERILSPRLTRWSRRITQKS